MCATGDWTLGIAIVSAPAHLVSARWVHRTQFVATPSPVLAPDATPLATLISLF